MSPGFWQIELREGELSLSLELLTWLQKCYTKTAIMIVNCLVIIETGQTPKVRLGFIILVKSDVLCIPGVEKTDVTVT